MPDEVPTPTPTGPTLANAPGATAPEPDTPAADGEWAAAVMNYFKSHGIDPEAAKAVGSKPHMGMVPFDADYVTVVGPFGGAETFADYDSWKAAAELQGEVDTLTFTFDGLIANIRNDPELSLSQKASRIAQVAGELGRRVEAQNSAAQGEDEKALDEPESEPFWFEAKDFSFKYAEDQVAIAEKVATKRDAGVELRASDFADVHDAAKPSTWGLPLVRGRSGGFDLGRIGDAITAIQPGQRVKLGSPKGRVVSRIRAAIGRAPGEAKRKTELRERLAKAKETTDGGSFSIFRDKAGALRWLTIHSNGYVDREGERFDEKAHDEYVRWVDEDKGARMPELRVFHVPGSGLGRADVVDHTSEGFMIASGTFAPEMEYVAKGLAERDDLGCSHGFWFDPDAFRGGVYHRYRSFEISILPRDRAANEVTGFIAGKEVPMPLTPEKKAELVEVGGADWAETVESGLTEIAKEAEDKGLSYKDIETRIVAALTPPATKDDDPADPNAGKPPETAEPIAAAIEPIAKAVAAVADQVKAIAATVEQQGDQIVALKESDATKIAESFRPRVTPGGGFEASKEGEEPDPDQVKQAEKDVANGVSAAMSPYFGDDGSLRGFGTPGPDTAQVPATAPTA